MTTLAPPRLTPKLWRPAPDVERPVRVLHVVPELSSGGMERAMLRLIQRSLMQDRELSGGSGIIHGICSLTDGGDGLADQCPSEVPRWALRPRRGLRRYRAWRGLRDVIQRFAPDVVHARSTGAWFDAASAVLGLPQVRLLLSYHGRTSLEPVNWRRRMVDRWTTCRANTVMTVSIDAAEMLRDTLEVPLDKLVTIYNGVDTNEFAPADNDAEIAATRQRIGLHSTSNVAICVSNLHPIKGLDVLIRSWRQVHMGDPLARLLLVGEGPLYRELIQQIQYSRCTSIIRLMGTREDVAPLLRAADVFVLPSWYEGCSNATLEAMASGLPVIGTSVGGMPELVAPQRTGWLVPPGNAEALSNALLSALLDRCARHRVGIAGRDVAVKQFGIDTWVARHASLYRRLAGVRPPKHTPREGSPCAE